MSEKSIPSRLSALLNEPGPWSMTIDNRPLTFAPPADGQYSRGNENAFSPLDAHEGLAAIRVEGLLLKAVPAFLRQMGVAATAYPWLRDQFEQAIEDRGVREISLRINSPGGTVAGLAPAVEMLYALRSRKPVVAVVESVCTGAAFWLGSQATRIIAVDRNAVIGGIGCFVSFPDFSEQFRKAEITTHVIASGPEKGMGVFGTAISEDQRAGYQSIVDSVTDNFVAAVVRGRQLTVGQIKPMADGKTWNASTARAAGLIDDIQA